MYHGLYPLPGTSPVIAFAPRLLAVASSHRMYGRYLNVASVYVYIYIYIVLALECSIMTKSSARVRIGQ